MKGDNTVTAVIMASGSGTGLWPMTDIDTPKAFARVSAGQTLLEATARRVKHCALFDAIVTVCERTHEYRTRKALNDAGARAARIICEKRPSGTAMTLACGALHALSKTNEEHTPVVAAIPVGHWIEDEQGWVRALEEAIAEARQGAACAVGCVAQRANQRYRYLQIGTPTGHSESGADVALHVPHPGVARSHTMTRDGEWRWDTAMYVLPAHTYLERAEHVIGDALEAKTRAWSEAVSHGTTTYVGAPEIEAQGRVDIHDVLDGCSKPWVSVEMAGECEDIGTWGGQARTGETEPNGNATEGPVVAYATTNSYIRADERPIIAIGVDDLVIVEGPAGVLITAKGRENELEGALNEMARKYGARRR